MVIPQQGIYEVTFAGLRLDIQVDAYVSTNSGRNGTTLYWQVVNVSQSANIPSQGVGHTKITLQRLPEEPSNSTALGLVTPSAIPSVPSIPSVPMGSTVPAEFPDDDPPPTKVPPERGPKKVRPSLVGEWPAPQGNEERSDVGPGGQV